MTGADSKMRGYPRSHGFDEIRLRRVLDYIAETLDQDITVAQLASVACLSPSHFASMFARAVGVAPCRYVSQQRLENAKMMLAEGKRSLSDIAFSCKFSSQTSFRRAFLRAIGVTPGEYRRARVEERYLPFQRAGSIVPFGGVSSEEATQNSTLVAASVFAEMAAAPHNMKAIAEASPALLWGSQPDGVCDYHNPALCARYGITSEQAFGSGWSSTVHHDDINALLEPWHASLKTGNPSKVLHRRRGYDGEYHRTISAWNPVRDEFGHIVRWSGTNVDLDGALGLGASP